VIAGGDVSECREEGAMRFGLFGSAEAGGDAAGTSRGQGFRNYIEYNVEAEALGYHSSFIVEHHFSGWSQVSATLQLLNWVAARTTTLRVGTAVMVLPWHNPVLLAEQAATLDVLSGGRLDLGVGKGYRYNEFKGFGIPIEEADARFEEALAILAKAWTSPERFSYQGRFWKFDDIVVEPAPLQKPHPPLWMGAANPASIQRVADRGYNLLLDQYASADAVGQRIALFRSEVERRGHMFDPMNVIVARDLYVAKNRLDKEEALGRHWAAQQRTLAVSRDPNRSGGSHILFYDHAGSDTENSMLYGTPDDIADKLTSLQRVGIKYIILNIGGMSRDSLRSFAREIMPAFTDGPSQK
jgi:alkanesulfonate monooxygenase SsuD/methylene tetrahydromethanopterin reductase-like flavin-dependent oxidoreductase (luciferase family)